MVDGSHVVAVMRVCDSCGSYFSVFSSTKWTNKQHAERCSARAGRPGRSVGRTYYVKPCSMHVKPAWMHQRLQIAFDITHYIHRFTLWTVC